MASIFLNPFGDFYKTWGRILQMNPGVHNAVSTLGEILLDPIGDMAKTQGRIVATVSASPAASLVNTCANILFNPFQDMQETFGRIIQSAPPPSQIIIEQVSEAVRQLTNGTPDGSSVNSVEEEGSNPWSGTTITVLVLGGTVLIAYGAHKIIQLFAKKRPEARQSLLLEDTSQQPRTYDQLIHKMYEELLNYIDRLPSKASKDPEDREKEPVILVTISFRERVKVLANGAMNTARSFAWREFLPIRDLLPASIERSESMDFFERPYTPSPSTSPASTLSVTELDTELEPEPEPEPEQEPVLRPASPPPPPEPQAAPTAQEEAPPTAPQAAPIAQQPLSWTERFFKAVTSWIGSLVSWLKKLWA